MNKIFDFLQNHWNLTILVCLSEMECYGHTSFILELFLKFIRMEW